MRSTDAEPDGRDAGPASLFDPATTVAVLVTFEPDIARLEAVFVALSTQQIGLVLVENGSMEAAAVTALASRTFGGRDAALDIVPLADNVGLAAAQNIGVGAARGQRATAVLLLDQDTVLPPGAVTALCRARNAVEASGAKVGAVGPVYFDATSERYSGAWQARGWRIGRGAFTPLAEFEVAPADFVIASGALIALNAWDAVGGMEAPLFIDLVDVEWGLRAQALGYVSYQVADVVIDHRIGEGRVRIGPITAPKHGPVRNYYWVRNALVLARRSSLPKAWRLYFLTRSLAYTAFYPLFGDRRWVRTRHIARGVRDGLLGRLG